MVMDTGMDRIFVRYWPMWFLALALVVIILVILGSTGCHILTPGSAEMDPETGVVTLDTQKIAEEVADITGLPILQWAVGGICSLLFGGSAIWGGRAVYKRVKGNASKD